MQLIINRSKNFVLALLGCVFLLDFYGANIEVIRFRSPDMNLSITDASTHVPQADSAEYADNADSIWKSFGPELKMDHKANSPQVKSEIRKILADKDSFNAILKSAAPYIYFIHQQTEARGLPAELTLIPVIESEFNPNDHSKKGATGLWQLMPQTAHELGVKIRASYDGRRNVVASTRAALAYFKDLGTMFHQDWYLAMAAYNCGQFKVASAVRRSGSHDFWSLRLPRETQLYVPKLLAVAEIIKHPDKYGVVLPPIDNQPYFKEVKVKQPVNLAKVAQSSGVSIKTLNQLNPDYNHRSILPTNGVYSILVPAKHVYMMEAQLNNHTILS